MNTGEASTSGLDEAAKKLRVQKLMEEYRVEKELKRIQQLEQRQLRIIGKLVALPSLAEKKKPEVPPDLSEEEARKLRIKQILEDNRKEKEAQKEVNRFNYYKRMLSMSDVKRAEHLNKLKLRDQQAYSKLTPEQRAERVEKLRLKRREKREAQKNMDSAPENDKIRIPWRKLAEEANVSLKVSPKVRYVKPLFNVKAKPARTKNRKIEGIEGTSQDEVKLEQERFTGLKFSESETRQQQTEKTIAAPKEDSSDIPCERDDLIDFDKV